MTAWPVGPIGMSQALLANRHESGPAPEQEAAVTAMGNSLRLHRSSGSCPFLQALFDPPEANYLHCDSTFSSVKWG